MAEITLFDGNGSPEAYIADDGDATIYMWDGTAVAYLHQEHVCGFNGAHLGWFDGGVVRDSKGAPVGFVKQKCSKVTKVEPVKKVKKTIKVKSVRKVAPVRPVNKGSMSSLPLEVFLVSGAK